MQDVVRWRFPGFNEVLERLPLLLAQADDMLFH
jgi:hypothetical protein